MKSKSSKPVSKVNKIDFTPIPNVQPQINSVPQMTNIQVAQFCSITNTSFRNCIIAYNSEGVNSSNFLKTQLISGIVFDRLVVVFILPTIF